MTHPTPGKPRRSLPWRPIGWGAVALILLLPALAIHDTTEVRWGAEDFLATALLLGLAGGTPEPALRHRPDRRRAWVTIAGVGTTLPLVWAELAVGLLR